LCTAASSTSRRESSRRCTATRDTYVDEVDARLDELIADGWFLEQFVDDLRQQAATAGSLGG